MKKQLFCVVIMSILCICALSIGVCAANVTASGTCGENVTWTLDSDGLLTISGTGDMEDYHYTNNPPGWKNYTVNKVVISNGVTSIGDHSFYLCTSLAEVNIANSVTMIGDGAFLSCSSMTSLDLPYGVTAIGESAFSQCSALTGISIPATVTVIERNAFDGCDNLSAVNISDLEAWCKIDFRWDSEWDEGYWQDCSSNPLYYAHNLYLKGVLIEHLAVPETITKLEEYVFYGASFSDVTLPHGITYIADGAFRKCVSLKNVYVHGAMTGIGNYSFTSCENLEKIEFSVLSTGEWKLLPKGPREKWNDYTGDYIVHCIDGTVSKSGVITYYPWVYLVSLSGPSSSVAKGTPITVTVTANKEFSAAELTLSYDTACLEFNKESQTGFNGAAVTVQDGVVKLAGFGASRSSCTLTFETISAGTANVTLTSAAFGTAEDAATKDLTAAIISDAIVSVTITEPDQTVTLPSDGSLNGSASVVYGETYTFSIADYNAHNNYVVTAKMGGDTVVVTDHGNGNYSISNVTGALEITVTATPKTYRITFRGAEDMSTLPESAEAVYGSQYSVALPEKLHYAVNVEAYYDTEDQTEVIYHIENGQLIIAGDAITGNMVIRLSWYQTDAAVRVEGSGKNDVQSYSEWAVYGQDYTLTVNQDSKYVYTVTATVNGTEVSLQNDGNAYTLSKEDIGEGAELVFTVEKALSMNISVQEYLTLDGTKLYLVLNDVDKVSGMVYCYGDLAMYWSEKYGAYCILVAASSAPAVDDITLTLRSGTAVEVDYSMDVNKSGKLDANDAQFVYNMYNCNYSGFTDEVTMEKYLRADVNFDRKIDVSDAGKIVNEIIK